MREKYLNFKFLVSFFAIVVLIVNLIIFGYHNHREVTASFRVSHDNTYLMLYSVHLGIAFCLGICVVGMLINRLWSWLTSLGTLLLSCGIYALWYFEKFDFMEGFECTFDNPKCHTIVEANFIQGIEMFRQETRFDIFSLVAVLFLILYVSIKIWKEYVKPKVIRFP